MRRPPRAHPDIRRTIAKSRLPKPRRPAWEILDEPLELYVSPELKERLGLHCKTTTDYLARLKGES